MPDKELRLLALDGGGIRGLSALVILGHLMERDDKGQYTGKVRLRGAGASYKGGHHRERSFRFMERGFPSGHLCCQHLRREWLLEKEDGRGREDRRRNICTENFFHRMIYRQTRHLLLV
jgi:hypothetical protein